MAEWTGWAYNNTAIYLDRPAGAEYVGLYVQYDDDVHQLGIFLSEDTAREFQAWVSAAIGATGQANALLVDELQRRG